jgi:hypothetical protein
MLSPPVFSGGEDGREYSAVEVVNGPEEEEEVSKLFFFERLRPLDDFLEVPAFLPLLFPLKLLPEVIVSVEFSDRVVGPDFPASEEAMGVSVFVFFDCSSSSLLKISMTIFLGGMEEEEGVVELVCGFLGEPSNSKADARRQK